MAYADPTPTREWGRLTWARVLFRALITLAALLAFIQPISAGSYLSGHFGALNVHLVNAYLATGATLLATLAALATWRRGGGAGWPTAVCASIFVLECVQIMLGYSLILSFHIVIGSLIVTTYAVLLVRVWRPARKAEAVPTWR